MNKHIAIASIFCVSITAGLFAEASTSAKDRIRELAEKPVDSNVARQWLELIIRFVLRQEETLAA